MFPGYVSFFKDIDGFIHLYFFPGIDDKNDLFFRDLDLSNVKMNYKEIKNIDESKEYIFENKNIKKITCKLLDNSGNLHIRELTI